MYITTTGLVLRETPYKESSRILTVLTASEGKITVSARGAKRRGSKIATAVQFLAYSDMTLLNSKGRWTLTEARSIELFPGLQEDIRLLALGSYFAEALEAVTDEDSPNPEMLSLGLNALFALSENKKPQELIKAAFEMRLMCIAGFGPVLDACGVCGREDVQEPELDLAGGILRCRECRTNNGGKSVPLCPGSLSALRHIAGADMRRLCSFTLGAPALKRLSEAAEAYMQTQLDSNFRTLDYYKNIKI